MAAEVTLLANSEQEHELLTNSIREARVGDAPVRLLEAGCGHHWWLRPSGVELHITGVDTDADALRIRRTEHGDLDEEILGDLRTVELPPGAFDVAYCSYVLEHVQGAADALATIAAAVRPGGIMIVRVPDGESVYGFIVRHTPHRAHVWYKKYVERKPHAGEPGHAPYPTVYEPVVSVRGLREWATQNGFEIVHEYGSNSYLRVFGPLRPVVAGMLRLIARLSRGRLTANHNNVGFVLRKRG
jgi:SAM-dependent methyltransferase